MEMINRNRLASEVAAVVENGGSPVGDIDIGRGQVDVTQKKTAVKKPAKKRTRTKAKKRA